MKGVRDRRPPAVQVKHGGELPNPEAWVQLYVRTILEMEEATPPTTSSAKDAA